MRIIRRLTAALVVLAICIASSARAQVLELVPSNSMVVIKIKNVQDVNDKVAALSKQWGLDKLRPELGDLLGTLLTVTNLGPGLNKTGEAAMAVMMPAPGEREPNMVVLVAVSDYKAFSGALPNAKPDGDLTMFSMGGNPKPGYAADWGKFAAISPSKDLLAKKGGGVKMSAQSAKEMAAKDLIIYANMTEIRKEVLPQFQQMKPQMQAMIGQAMMNAPGANPKMAPLMKAYFGQFLNVVEGVLTDADGASFGVNLSKEGISTTLMADFNPDSYAGKAFKSMKNSDASFTAGLPDGKYFLYGGGVVDKAGIQMFSDFIAPIEKEAAAMPNNEGKAIAAYISSAKSYMESIKQINFGVIAPPAAALGKEGFLQGVGVITGDSAKMIAAQKNMIASEAEFMKMAGGMDMKIGYTPSAKTVDGVSLDQFTATFNGQPQTPQEQQMMMLMTMMYGPNGMSGYSGAIGADKVISAMGVNDDLLTATIKAAKNNEDPLGKGASAKVNAALPQNRLAVYYLQIDTIASTILDVMAAKGVPGGVKLPPNLPPLAGAFDVEGSAIRLDGYIPAETVEKLISAGLQAWMQQMPGGGQPGGL
jgi:hypothetical protein